MQRQIIDTILSSSALLYLFLSAALSLSFSIDQHVTEKLKFIDRLIIPSKALSVSWGTDFPMTEIRMATLNICVAS